MEGPGRSFCPDARHRTSGAARGFYFDGTNIFGYNDDDDALAGAPPKVGRRNAVLCKYLLTLITFLRSGGRRHQPFRERRLAGGRYKVGVRHYLCVDYAAN